MTGRLPTAALRPAYDTLPAETVSLVINRGAVEQLRRVAAASGGTLDDAMATAFAWWLHEQLESTDVVVDLNGVALHWEVSGDDPFSALVARRAVGMPGDARANDLFRVRLLSPVMDVEIELCEQVDGSIAGEFSANADMFDRRTAQAMASHWVRVLDAVAARPEIAMDEHYLATAEDIERQLRWNQTAALELSRQCVHDVIRTQAERTPSAVAVVAGAATLTYRQLADRARTVSTSLITAGIGPGSVVAVLLDRTPELVAAILGVLESGAAVLPLDPRQPVARNAFCINDVGAQVVLTDRRMPTGGEAITATVMTIGALEPGQDASPRFVSSHDLAYVVCTSGSTGRPKPVLVEHLGVTNLTHALGREFGIATGDTVLSVAPISFDMALFDIFSALACGARVVLATAADATNPAALDRLMAPSGATYMFATPTIWSALIAAGWRGDRRMHAAAGGETLSAGVAEALLQRCGAVWNGYGPTETTGGATMARLAHGDAVTVGWPLPNVRVYVTDRRGRLQPVGVPGEITIGGVGVGRGYLNRPAENAGRFADDPFNAGGRIYRTGDRGRFLPDGRLQHLGRYDDQVKIRGVRIEPGEIESILCEHPDVGGCAVVAHETDCGERELVAYIVGSSERFGGAEARDWLRSRLPEYMMPAEFVRVAELPLTASGKLDRVALCAAPRETVVSSSARPPQTDVETRVAELWAELLGMPVTDVDSDFFDLGGHSLLAARLIAEIERTFGVVMSLDSFIDSGRVVGKLAALLSAESSRDTVEHGSCRPMHFIFPDVVSSMSLRHFTEQWGSAQPVHALIPDQPDGRFDRSVSIEDHARQALSVIRSRQQDGPLRLAGYSIGGLVAYEVARQAVARGWDVEWLGILDAVAPPMHELRRAQLTLRSRFHSIRRRSPGERLAAFEEVAIRLWARRSWSAPRFDYRGGAEIACAYRAPGHQVPLHLYVSEASAAGVRDDALGWRAYHRGSVSAHRLAGSHVGILQQPQAARLAAGMFDSVRAATLSHDTASADATT